MSKKSAPGEPADDPGEERLREMILDALNKAGGENWLRRHGGDHLVPAYRRERERRLGTTSENSGS
jgi:hypothetical protein